MLHRHVLRGPRPSSRGSPHRSTSMEPEPRGRPTRRPTPPRPRADRVASPRPERDPQRPVYVISVAASIVSVASADAAHLRGRGPALSGPDADQHPSLQRERHPPDPVDPAPDPGAGRQPRRDPHPVRAGGAPRRPHPRGAVRRGDRADAPASPTRSRTHHPRSIDGRPLTDRHADPPVSGAPPRRHRIPRRRTPRWPSDRPTPVEEQQPKPSPRPASASCPSSHSGRRSSSRR